MSGSLVVDILIEHNHSSGFTVAVVNYHMFGWLMNNCDYNYICFASHVWLTVSNC